jgi:ribose transport system ATP-binding protein
MNSFLQLDQISKSFFGVTVLRDISFTLETGKTLGLVGENGAGKSTLMNLLGGNLQPDGGTMLLAGENYAPRRARDATAKGIVFIHQELNLFSNLSIAENIWITNFPSAGKLPLIQRKKLRDQTRALLAQVELDLPPDTPVEHLPQGERQLVEIAKALSVDARLIIFDEPTTSLTSRETERLFALMQRLRQRGIAMIYISHVLADVLRLCDDIAVLRDGEIMARKPAADFSIGEMVSLMVGRSIKQFFPPRPSYSLQPESEPVLEVRGVSQPGIVENIHFTLHRREVLGISGLMGSGRSETARILFGLDPRASGSVRLRDAELPAGNPRESIRRGVAFLTEDRRAEGLCMDASIADNMALVTLREHARNFAGFIDRTGLKRVVANIREAVRLNASARSEQPVKTLSGGKSRSRQMAAAKTVRPHPRRTDARHRCRSKNRDLQPDQRTRRRRRGHSRHFVGNRGIDRHLRPHSRHAPG